MEKYSKISESIFEQVVAVLKFYYWWMPAIMEGRKINKVFARAASQLSRLAAQAILDGHTGNLQRMLGLLVENTVLLQKGIEQKLARKKSGLASQEILAAIQALNSSIAEKSGKVSNGLDLELQRVESLISRAVRHYHPMDCLAVLNFSATTKQAMVNLDKYKDYDYRPNQVSIKLLEIEREKLVLSSRKKPIKLSSFYTIKTLVVLEAVPLKHSSLAKVFEGASGSIHSQLYALASKLLEGYSMVVDDADLAEESLKAHLKEVAKQLRLERDKIEAAVEAEKAAELALAKNRVKQHIASLPADVIRAIKKNPSLLMD